MVTGADLGRGEGPSADRGLLVARPQRDPGRARPWSLLALGAPAAPGPAGCGRRDPGTGSRARARAPQSPAAAASPSLGSPSSRSVICSRPAGPLPAFPPGRGHRGDRPLPTYRPPPRGLRPTGAELGQSRAHAFPTSHPFPPWAVHSPGFPHPGPGGWGRFPQGVPHQKGVFVRFALS